jgi:hypothetical protein
VNAARWRRAALGAVLAAVLAGCGGGPAPAQLPTAPSAPPVPAARDLAPATAEPSGGGTGGDSGGAEQGGGGGGGGGGDEDGDPVNESGVEADAQAGEFALPALQRVDCPTPTTTVTSAEELSAALTAAAPGQVIRLADGNYQDNFVATASGTPTAPIFLCGGRGAVLDGGGTTGGYVFHLDGAEHWRLVGFTVRNGQKGVMADATTGTVIQDLAVNGTGDEAVHLRRNSTDNLVVGNVISDTGQRRDKFGEGVYIGTAVSNWCTISDCLPDRSDRNVIAGNTISDTTAEAVDIKEGTTGGLLVDNTFDGAGNTEADSWVDVKGTAWTIRGNRGTNAPLDGFQTHQIEDRWGERNLFEDNTISGAAGVDDRGKPAYGIALRPVGDNIVRCDNTATGGIELANIECT